MTARRTRRLYAAIATAGVLLAAAACSSGGTATSTSSAAGSAAATPSGSGAAAAAASYLTPPTALPVTTPVSKPIPTGLKITFVQGGYPEAITVLAGLKAAAATLGWSVQSMTYDPTNPATITSSIQSAIAEKPAAIILDGLLTAQFAKEIQPAAAAHIPLIPAAAPDEAQAGIYPVQLSQVENAYDGKIVAATLAADAARAGTTAHVLQLTVPAAASVLDPEDAGVKSELAAICSSCTRDLLSLNLADVYNGRYTQQVVSYLQRHPQINYIVSDSGQLGDGLPAALAQAGITNVKIYGMSATNVQIKELQSGQPGAWAVQPYQAIGWMIADQIARVTVGDPTDAWDNEHLAYVVTSANAKSVNPNDPEFPAGYEAQFSKLWGK
jgi:ribose transport system substrate-binding protein